MAVFDNVTPIKKLWLGMYLQSSIFAHHLQLQKYDAGTTPNVSRYLHLTSDFVVSWQMKEDVKPDPSSFETSRRNCFI
jgi:hypothetical protein